MSAHKAEGPIIFHQGLLESCQLMITGNARSEICDCQVYRKDHDVTLMLLSDSITGTLFKIYQADQIASGRSASQIERRWFQYSAIVHS